MRWFNCWCNCNYCNWYLIGVYRCGEVLANLDTLTKKGIGQYMENKMELKDFVSETLKQIMDGVKMAPEKAEEMGGAINPRSKMDVENGIIMGPIERVVRLVNFDVAISTSDASRAKGGAGVFVGEIGIGARGSRVAGNGSKQDSIYRTSLFANTEDQKNIV